MKLSLPVLGIALCFAWAAVAAPISYNAALSGPSSPGTGTTFVTIDTTANTLFVQASFSGLLGPTTASHIHCCIASPGNAGVATQVPSFIGFPLGVTAGTFSNTLNLLDPTSWNPAFIAAEGGTAASAEAVLAAGLASGEAYLNIHTTAFPGGEIRGFYALVTPEPGTFGLAVFGAAGLLAWRRRRRASL